jgi:hypothetical protein
VAWETAAGAADFGRGDLNNDRRTGGDGKRPFDLDANGRRDGRLEVPVVARERIFDEAGLTDVAIACYYAYSSVYTGNEAARDLLLQPYREQGHCGEGTEVTVSASFPAVVVAGSPETFEITVLDLDGQPVPGLYVAVEVSGGTVGRSSGETDGGGKFRTQATINPGASSIAVTATVREAPEGEVIDVVSRSATAAGLGTVTLLRRWSGVVETALPHFRVTAAFTHNGSSPAPVFQNWEENVPATQVDFSDLTANLVARGSGSFDGVSATAEAQGTRTETVRIVDGRFVGVVQSTSFSARASMTNPPAASVSLAKAWAGADIQSCFDFRVDGAGVRYVLELTGSSSNSMHVGARLIGGGTLVDYSTGGAAHALSREGVLGVGASTFCVYLTGQALWESHRRTQLQTEIDGHLDVRFTLEPVPPP